MAAEHLGVVAGNLCQRGSRGRADAVIAAQWIAIADDERPAGHCVTTDAVRPPPVVPVAERRRLRRGQPATVALAGMGCQCAGVQPFALGCIALPILPRC